MEKIIEKHRCNLEIYANNTNNPKEESLINDLDDLLSRAANRRFLKEVKLKKAKHKVSIVPCFSEKYMDMVAFLENYFKLRMSKIIVSPSILGYETNLDGSIENIRKILSCGIEWLHIDVMRKPFIPSKNTFSEESMSKLYNEFADKAKFDFHLMISEPDQVIETINKIISDPDKRRDTIITIHREAYRNGLGVYNSKEYDLFEISTGNSSLDERLRAANIESGELVCRTLKTIKDGGYKTGLALEPGTSLNNVSKEMLNVMDMILLMSVSSGAGGQGYRQEVTDKIGEAYQRYGRLMIQVDGGINEATLPEVIEAGANNIVIGSCITKSENPIDPINRIKKYMEN